MPTKSAGRVSIRVLPDSSRFRDELKVTLERVEKTMKAEIPAHLAVTRESIRQLREQLRDLEARVKIEPYITEEQLHELKRKIEDIDPRINADLNALNAQRRLAVLTRDRTVSVFVRVNQASLAAAAATLAGLSGGRLITNVLSGFLDRIRDLDKNAPRIALISTAITALGGGVLALVSNLGTLSGSFANLGKTTIFLPALLSAAGISIGVLVAAFKDMKKVLADLKPGFKQLQDTISSRFWDQAAQPIRNMTNNLMPQLKASLGDVAEAWGRLFGNMAREIQANVTPQELAFMMGNLTKSINIASGAMKPMIHSFNTLGRFGSQYLPRMSDFLVKITTDFDAFITKADEDGRLVEWAESGIKATKDLGKVLYETGRVFSALNMAAKRAGGADFEGLAGGLKKLSDVMRTEGFQKGFETIFSGAHKAMDGLFDGLKRLGPGLSIFAVTINSVFSTVGKILGQLGEDLSELFMNARLNEGIKDFFSGFLTFVTDLKPAMGPLGQIIGTLASAMGNLLSQVGPVLAEIAQILAPLFEQVWEAVKPLIPDLMSLVSLLVKELGPILTEFVKEVLPPLIPIIKDLIPIVADLVKATSPVLVAFFKDLGEALRVAGPHISAAATWVGDLVKALDLFPKAFYQGATGDKKSMIETLSQIAIDHPEIPVFFEMLGKALGGIFDKISGAGNVGGVIATLANPTTGIPALASTIMGVVTAADLLFGISDKWNGFWSGLQEAVTNFQSLVPPGLATAFGLIGLAFAGINLNKPGWDGFWGGLPAPVGLALTASQLKVDLGLMGIITKVATFFATQEPAWNGFWTRIAVGVATGMASMNTNVSGGFPAMLISVAFGMARMLGEFGKGWEAIRVIIPRWFETFAVGVGLGISVVVAKLGGMPTRMLAVVWSAVENFRTAGAALIGAFASGISSGQNAVVKAIVAVVAEVSKHLPHSPAKKGPLSGRGYPLYSGRATVEAFAQGMKQRTEALGRQTRSTLSAVQFNGASVSTGSASSVAGGVDPSRDRALVNIEGNYYGATPEEVADEFDTKLRRSNLVAQLSKVGK